MRLKLVRHAPQPEPGEKGWRLLETGELTLGRASGNDWVLVDPDRRISGTHCRIGRDGKGFWLKDESTNGLSLDGRPLAQGEKVPLRDGSSLEFCGQRFVAEITGELEPDWVEPDHSHIISDEAPSITSILADVSPSGRTASGLIPGRVGDDVFDATPPPSGTMDVFEDRISRDRKSVV